MVSAGTNDSDIDSVLRIPPSKAIDDIDAVACVQVVDSSFTIDLPDLQVEEESASIID